VVARLSLKGEFGGKPSSPGNKAFGAAITVSLKARRKVARAEKTRGDRVNLKNRGGKGAKY